jgi:hypothetical protein
MAYQYDINTQPRRNKRAQCYESSPTIDVMPCSFNTSNHAVDASPAFCHSSTMGRVKIRTDDLSSYTSGCFVTAAASNSRGILCLAFDVACKSTRR